MRRPWVVRAIKAAGGRAVVVLGDLTRNDETDRVADLAVAALGGIDILVNNAGGSGPMGSWDRADPDEGAGVYDRNVLAVVRLIRRLVPPMRSARWGRVANISSGAYVMPAATGADYSAAKAALNNLTVFLAKAVGADGVTVNAVSPGTIFTPKLENAFREMARARGWADNGRGSWADVERAVLAEVVDFPIPRVGWVEEVASAVVFLCSPLSGFITGSNLRVDGGIIPLSDRSTGCHSN